MKVAPCKGCEERKSGCHAECESYKKWKAAVDEANTRRIKEGESWRAFYGARKRRIREKNKWRK